MIIDSKLLCSYELNEDWGQTVAAGKGAVTKAEIFLNTRESKWDGKKKNQELFPLHEELWSQLPLG